MMHSDTHTTMNIKHHSNAITQYFAIGTSCSFLFSFILVFKHFYFRCVARQLHNACLPSHGRCLLLPLHNIAQKHCECSSGKVLRGNQTRNCAMLFMLFPMYTKIIFRSAETKKHYREHYVSEFWFAASRSYINSIVKFVHIPAIHLAMKIYTI